MTLFGSAQWSREHERHKCQFITSIGKYLPYWKFRLAYLPLRIYATSFEKAFEKIQDWPQNSVCQVIFTNCNYSHQKMVSCTPPEETLLESIIGKSAVFVCCLMGLPQALKTIRSGETSALSFPGLALTLLNCILWAIYGCLKSLTPVIFSNLIFGSLTAVCFMIKLKNQIGSMKRDPNI